ncbi:hypothetical protein Leryth_014239 [Lithospermum erythrorhizon]|nr:hypothetical protein Leryth_014239 [Lithospermum erythrorhizon]
MQLTIPPSFTKNLKEKLGETVSLKVPSGATWYVGLLAREDTLFLRKGWKDFVVDNSLKENDLLIFKYFGESHFEVLLFDGQSQNEKASSYFVRNRSRSQQEVNCGEKVTQVLTEKSQRCSDNLLASAERSGDRDVASAERSEDTVVASADRSDDRNADISKVAKTDATSTPTSAWQTYQTNEPIQGERTGLNICGGRGLTNMIESNPAYLASSGRPATAEEKLNALQRANAVSSPNSLVVVMQPSQVSKHYFMLIPSWYSNLHLPLKNIDIILRVEGSTWKTTYFCNKSIKVGGGRLRGGWKKFALDNHLEEFDVCIFNKSETTSDAIYMDVSIVRARDEEINSSSPSSDGQ